MPDTQHEPGESDSQSSQPNTLKSYITRDMVATTLFVMRFCTILGTLVFVFSMLGLFGMELGYKCYLNAMMTAFFTFSIRLYQRKQEKQVYVFSKEMYLLFTNEDAGHYMLYTFFYYNQYPLSIYLLPPFLYAILFSVKYTNGLIPFLPPVIGRLLVLINSRIAAGQMELRRLIAYTEIFLMVVVTCNALTGFKYFLVPFVHYYFLKFRYQSLRNNSVSLVFSELRLGAEYLSNHPRCPSFVSTSLTTAITCISRLAPARQMRREP